MENVFTCPICGGRTIDEERPNHKCDMGYRIEKNVLRFRSRDGVWKELVIPPSVMERIIERMKDEGFDPLELATRFGHPEEWTVYISACSQHERKYG